MSLPFGIAPSCSILAVLFYLLMVDILRVKKSLVRDAERTSVQKERISVQFVLDPQNLSAAATWKPVFTG